MRKSTRILLGAVAFVGAGIVIAILVSRHAPFQPIVLRTIPAPSQAHAKSHSPVVLDELPASTVAPDERVSATEPEAKPESDPGQEPNARDSANHWSVTLTDADLSDRAVLEEKMTRFLKNQEAARGPR